MTDQELIGRLGKMSIMSAAGDIVTQLAGTSYAQAMLILSYAADCLEARVKSQLVPAMPSVIESEVLK